jgi:ArsR family transcriptional regulator
MNHKNAVVSLAALAQDSRLAVYRQLVQAGPDGIAAGELAERVGIPANTLSFHLKTLSHARLVEARHSGRFVYYSANYATMNSLLEFLGDNCCGGRPCAPVASVREPRRQA